MSPRLVVVLGYSDGESSLHPICTARLRRAEALARPEDVVLLSGWARHPSSTSEAELMERAWGGPSARLITSADARTTYGNARAAAAAAAEVGAHDVVLVTSRWHERRAARLFRAALRGSGPRLVLASADGKGTRAARLRELVCWTFVPVQAVVAARRSPAPGEERSAPASSA